MQIVIDIDESLYNAINQDIYINGMRSGKTILQKLVNAIGNGTVLPSPCDVCRFRPPSSADGKPCCMCPATGRGK